MLTLHAAPARAMRDHVLPVMTGLQRVGTVMATQDSEIDITYRHSPIVREHHRQGIALHDAGVAARVAERYGDRVRPLVVDGDSLRDPEGTLHRRYHADPCSASCARTAISASSAGRPTATHCSATSTTSSSGTLTRQRAAL